MPFLTYAQNCEDLMLYDALRGVDRGLHFDLNAVRSSAHTVTCAFYERAGAAFMWSPILDRSNASPRRSDEVKLKAAVSEVSGHAVSFFVGEFTGLNSVDAEMARLRPSQGTPVRAETVLS